MHNKAVYFNEKALRKLRGIYALNASSAMNTLGREEFLSEHEPIYHLEANLRVLDRAYKEYDSASTSIFELEDSYAVISKLKNTNGLTEGTVECLDSMLSDIQQWMR